MDYDHFKQDRLVQNRILNKIDDVKPYTVTRRVEEQLNLILRGVKFTFFEYPYPVEVNSTFEDIIKLPDLLNLASMKAFALGRRSKWKDYVDLYFILKNHYSIKQITEKSLTIYGQLFSEKLFRSQLCYFDDIDYTEEVEYIVKQPSNKEIKGFLTEKALEVF